MKSSVILAALAIVGGAFASSRQPVCVSDTAVVGTQNGYEYHLRIPNAAGYADPNERYLGKDFKNALEAGGCKPRQYTAAYDVDGNGHFDFFIRNKNNKKCDVAWAVKSFTDGKEKVTCETGGTVALANKWREGLERELTNLL